MTARRKLNLAQSGLLAARSIVRRAAGRMNANVDYDLHLYDAIHDLRAWSPGDVVFDVGANDGRTVFRLMRHLPSPRIVAFEPVESTYRTLCEQTAGLEGVEAHRLALGSAAGRRTIHLNGRAVLASFEAGWGEAHGQPAAAGPETEEVEVATVDGFAAVRGFEHIHLLKVDTEGHDLEVLKGAAGRLRAGGIDLVQVEAGFPVPGRRQPLLTEIQSYLEAFGYYLHGVFNQCRAAWPQAGEGRVQPASVLLFCDALFVRAGQPVPEAVAHGAEAGGAP